MNTDWRVMLLIVAAGAMLPSVLVGLVALGVVVGDWLITPALRRSIRKRHDARARVDRPHPRLYRVK